jgi:hypothetical protein
MVKVFKDKGARRFVTMVVKSLMRLWGTMFGDDS